MHVGFICLCSIESRPLTRFVKILESPSGGFTVHLLQTPQKKGCTVNTVENQGERIVSFRPLAVLLDGEQKYMRGERGMGWRYTKQSWIPNVSGI